MREGGLQHAKVTQGERNITEYPLHPGILQPHLFLGSTNEIRVFVIPVGVLDPRAFFVLVTLKKFERRRVSMKTARFATILTAPARLYRFEEDVYRDLQKWKRCASP